MMGEAALVLFLPQVERERNIISVLLQPQGWRDMGCAALPSLLQGFAWGKLFHESWDQEELLEMVLLWFGESRERMRSAPSCESSAVHGGHFSVPQCLCVPLVNRQRWLLSFPSRKAFCGLSNLRAFSVLELQLVMLVKGGCLSGRLLIMGRVLLPIQNCYSVSVLFHFTASPSVFDICKFFK